MEDHMEEEYFCLKWSDHRSNMLHNFEMFLKNEDLCDVTIACDGLSIKAHKLVLSASSPFFHKLFLDNPSTNPIVILSDIKYDDLKTLIDFMYHGHVNVSENQLSLILKAAENLKIKGLGNYMEELLNDDDQSSVLKSKPMFSSRNANNSDYEKDSNVSHFKEKAQKIHTDHSYVEEAASYDQQSEMYYAETKKLKTLPNDENPIELVNTFDSNLDINPSKLMEQSMTTEDGYAKKLFMGNSPEYESCSYSTPDKNIEYDSVHIKLPSSAPELESSDLCLSQTYDSSEGSTLQLATLESLSSDNSKRGRKPGSRLCVMCKHVFHSESELEKHMDDHKSTSFCDDTDSTKLPVLVEFNESQPVTEKNLLKLPLLCSTCKYVMNTLSDAQSHLSSNPNCRTSQFKCLLCPKLFIWPATLMKHFREQHEGPGGITRVARRMWYFCDVCKKPLLSKHALSLHRSKFHGLNQPNTAGTEENLDNCKRGRKRGTRVCGICKRTFLGSDYFTHVQTVHKNISLSDSSVDASTYMNESISMDNESNSTQSAA